MPANDVAAFISYSREDSEFTLRLAQDLKAAGSLVWLDQLDIEPGVEWDNAIEIALKHAPRMILILSPSSASSRNVRNEISFALDAGKIIIPVLHRDCDVPLQLMRVQHVDFRGDYAQGFAALLRYLPAENRDAAISLEVPQSEKQAAPRSWLHPSFFARRASIEHHNAASSSRMFAQASHKTPASSRRLWIALTSVLALLVIAAGWKIYRMKERTAATFRRLTFQRGNIPIARFTRDGQTVLYGGQFDNDPLQIYSVRLRQLDPVKLTLPSTGLLSVSSRDEMAISQTPRILDTNSLVLGVLSTVPVSGGSPRAVQDGVISADYAPDGKTLALTRFVNGMCWLEYPTGKKLYESSGYMDFVRVSPDGKSVAFDEHPIKGDDKGWVSVVDKSGKELRLSEEYDSAEGLAWARNGHEIWFTASPSGKGYQLYGVTPSGKLRLILGVPGTGKLQDIAADGRVLLAIQTDSTTISAGDGIADEVQHLELYDGSHLSDISSNGKAILFEEHGGPVGILYDVVYRKTDGSPPVKLGTGARPRFSPDGSLAAAVVESSPPQLALLPIGAGTTRTIALPTLAVARDVHWLPDGTHALVWGSAADEAPRTFIVDLKTSAVAPFGPPRFYAMAATPDGQKVVGWLATGPVIYEPQTNKIDSITGVTSEDRDVLGWTADGNSLLIEIAHEGNLSVYQLNLATGQRTLLKTRDASYKGGLLQNHLMLAANQKSYAYWQVSTLSSLYEVSGLH